jgi:hypothetical protein
MGVSTRMLVLIGLLILGAIVGLGWLFRDAIDPPPDRAQVPASPPKVDPPDFRMPGLPDAPER